MVRFPSHTRNGNVTPSDNLQGDGKTGDAANFGLFKQNWGMLRVCASRAGFAGQAASSWNNGAKVKYVTHLISSPLAPHHIFPGHLAYNRYSSDIYADVAARWDCQNYYGYDKWFAGHRNGASGLSNPYTQDISNYKTAVQWIQSQVDSDAKYKSDDTRFWVDVVAI
jgi:hypothetical protein